MVAIFICAVAICCPNMTEASQIAENVTVVVNGEPHTVRAMNQDLQHNAYVSVRDLAMCLKGSSKEYKVSFETIGDEDFVVIEYGEYEPVGGENTPYDTESMDAVSWILNNTLNRYKVRINNQDCNIYGIKAKNAEGMSDFFMSTGELAIYLNIDMQYQDNQIYINPEQPHNLSFDELNSQGFFHMTNSCLVGDATTGEIYYSFEEDKPVSIASTTKLMTYYVIMDGVKNGEISLDDWVTFSREVARESRTENGVIVLNTGDSAPILEVMKAMLIRSSNECALALAEHLCGSSDEFVSRMNDKASALGLSDGAVFYNSNGLPLYQPDKVMSSKTQNRMSVKDMFILVSNLLSDYPEVTDITSIKMTHLDVLNVDLVNTNSLLFNLPEVVGLKTGTTTKAGSCLVAASKVMDADNNEHYIVTVEYGAENAQIQSYTSLVLMKCGLKYFEDIQYTNDTSEVSKLPEGPEELIKAVIRTAKKR